VTVHGQIREGEKQNMIRDGTTVRVFGKAGYKEGWRSEMELNVL
jgi:hypothetical protein